MRCVLATVGCCCVTGSCAACRRLRCGCLRCDACKRRTQLQQDAVCFLHLICLLSLQVTGNTYSPDGTISDASSHKALHLPSATPCLREAALIRCTGNRCGSGAGAGAVLPVVKKGQQCQQDCSTVNARTCSTQPAHAPLQCAYRRAACIPPARSATTPRLPTSTAAASTSALGRRLSWRCACLWKRCAALVRVVLCCCMRCTAVACVNAHNCCSRVCARHRHAAAGRAARRRFGCCLAVS